MSKKIIFGILFLLLQSGIVAKEVPGSRTARVLGERTFLVEKSTGGIPAHSFQSGGTRHQQTSHLVKKYAGGSTINASLQRSKEMTPLNSAAGVNITPFQPTSAYDPYFSSAWDDEVVISNVRETVFEPSTITDKDSIFIDWAMINNGTDVTSDTFWTALYIDNIELTRWYTYELKSNFYAFVLDARHGPLPAGIHTIRVIADVTGALIETDESDNEYQKQQSIEGVPIAITSPAGGDSWPAGSLQDIVFSTNGISNVDIQWKRSTDGSWFDVAAGYPASAGKYRWATRVTPGEQIQVRVRNSNDTTVFAASEFFTVTDARPADSYWFTQFSNTNYQFQSVEAVDNNTVFVVGNTSTEPVVMRTIDGGVNWTDARGNLPLSVRLYAVEAQSAFDAWVGDGAGNVYKTTDGGNTWSNVYTFGSFVDDIVLAGSNLVAMSDDNSLLKISVSTDGGISWLPASVPSEPSMTISYPNTMSAVGNTVFAGTGVGKLLKSTDGGFNWFVASNALALNNGVSFADASNGIVLNAAAYYNTWRSADGGFNGTTDLNLAPNPYSVQLLENTNPYRGWIVGSRGLVLSTNDGGNSWQQMNTGSTESFPSLSFISENNGWIVSYTGTILRYNALNQLSTPDLLSPFDGATVTPPVMFEWGSVVGATEYELEIGSYVDGGTVFQSRIVSSITRSKEMSGLAAGTTYEWRMRAKSFSAASPWSPFRSFSTTTVQMISQQTAAVFPASPSSSTDYRLVTFPSTGFPTVASLFSGSIGTDYRIYRDNGGIPPDHLVELTGESSLNWGEGYWLIKKGDFVVNQNINFPPVVDGSITLSLKNNNWNIIGNPYAIAVAWSDVLLANGLPASAPLYAYDGVNGFVTSPSLKPFVGYYYFSTAATVKIPYPFANSPAPVQQSPSMRFGIRYASSFNIDESAFIGIDDNATNGMDNFDSRKPPLFSDQGSLWFDRPEWDPQHSRFAGDVRPSLGEGQTWNFVVRHPARETARLRITNIDRLPGGYSAVLLNKSNGVITRIAHNEDIDLSLLKGETPLSLIIGKSNYIRANTQEFIPRQFELLQNYPNPFNPSTTIRFGIPEDAFVHVTMYDLLGREIATLLRDALIAGHHEQVFDGSALASGTYLFTLKAISLHSGKILYTSTKKMVLLK